MFSFVGQAWTLVVKNLLIIFFRPWLTTSFRAIIGPIGFICFLTYAQNLFVPPSLYGFGESVPVLSLKDALQNAGGGRDRVAFVNSGHTDGDIDRVISRLQNTVRSAGLMTESFRDKGQLNDYCESSLRGASKCFGAAVFHSSPSEGNSSEWNYTIRADAALGKVIKMSHTHNDAQLYTIPLQHAIDTEIAALNSSIPSMPPKIYEYPYTTLSEKQRKDDVRTRYAKTIIDYLGVGFLIGIIGVTYQLTGLIASERELGMSQLIDCMIPHRSQLGAQAVRLLSAHIALDLIYLPSWIVCGIVEKVGVFKWSNAGIVIGFNILTGFSLSSFSMFIASFFKKAQISGIFSTLLCLLLGIVAQLTNINSSAGIAVLSLLFPPMNFVYFTILIARWERQETAADLIKSAPENEWTVCGIVFWIFAIVQIIVYPIFAIITERILFDTSSEGRKEMKAGNPSTPAVMLDNFTKEYKPNWLYRTIASRFGSQRHTVKAVDNMSLSVMTGEIMVLLGANGSGKSTLLTAVSGLSRVTSGKIVLNYLPHAGGFGLCPQHNVLWDRLTVEEHVKIFSRLKGGKHGDTKQDMLELIKACDLETKKKAYSRTLSGGQKRKLQLAMMFTGGSSICCVDEVSSGIDPVSRRKVWDILLAERGKRTIILTTHFLDEADLLADHIAIMAKGVLKAQGTSVELKQYLGSGYRVHAYIPPGEELRSLPRITNAAAEVQFNELMYNVDTGSEVAQIVASLEEQGFEEYRVSPPTIEDVFLKVAENTSTASDSSTVLGKEKSCVNVTHEEAITQGAKLSDGKRIGMVRQAQVLFLKRLTILRRNWVPYVLAFIIPVIAAGCVTLFLSTFDKLLCDGPNTTSSSKSSTTDEAFSAILAPANRFSNQSLNMLAESLAEFGKNDPGDHQVATIRSNLRTVDTYDQFNQYVHRYHDILTPGGIFLGDNSHAPTFAWRADGGSGSISFSTMVQNMLDTSLLGTQIKTDFETLDVPWAPGSGQALQLIVYFELAMICYPAFFALYPTLERLRGVRALHYSNGVRSLPLWLAYLSFDFIIVLAASVLVVVIWAAISNVWYHLGYLFVVLLLYGLASTLVSYVVSLFATSQLAAFAFAAGGQACMFLIYFIVYLCILTYAAVSKIDSDITLMHFVISVFSPTGSLTRSMFVTLNMFSILCRDKKRASYPGGLRVYGGPILYLIVQCLILFGILLWWDSGPSWRKFLKSKRSPDDDETTVAADSDLGDDTLKASNDGLRVLHLNKKFGKLVAVEDVTFGAPRGEVFALLGPNGAGKSTTISLIRGDISPSTSYSEILVSNVSVIRHRAEARSYLGVCPQFDAMDQMTVIEQLKFYARVRGVSDIEHNVNEVVRAVGLEPFRNRMAAKLSGGNKRKLSLGVALMGNPAVLLLDEPSSGMDAAAKRVMWRTLASIVPGRSVVLTTHSMEEADALASRAGIVAKRMLEIGTTEGLRQKYGNVHHVHIVHKDAPHTSDEAMKTIVDWVLQTFPGANIEQKTYHGQLRFTVPASSKIGETCTPLASSQALNESSSSMALDNIEDEDAVAKSKAALATMTTLETVGSSAMQSGFTIGALFALLEKDKDVLGFEHYSISQTSLDQIFLEIVGKHYDENA